MNEKLPICGLRPVTLLKKRLQLFSSEICEIFKNTYFEEHLWTTASNENIKSEMKMSNYVCHYYVLEAPLLGR